MADVPARAPEGIRCVLEVVKGRDRGSVFRLAVDEVEVGRGVHDTQLEFGTGIRLTDPSVSREHATLCWDRERNRYGLVNRSQTNPTCVNGKEIENVFLEDGDEIRLGAVVLKVYPASTPGREATAGATTPHPASLDEKTTRIRRGVRTPSDRPRVAPDPSGKTVVFSRSQLQDGARRARVATVGANITTGRIKGRPRRADLAQLFGQMGMMLDLGIHVARALDLLAAKGSAAAVRDVSEHLAARVGNGEYLSAAMKHSGVFSALHVHAVEAGEQCGHLPVILKELGRWEERDLSLTRAVTGSLTYPATVLALGVIIVFFLGNRVFSALGPILASSGKPLPLVTQALCQVSDLLHRPLVLFVVLVAAGAAVAAVRAWIRTDRGRVAWDRLALRLPVLGTVIRKLFVARFCNHLRLLYSVGVPLLGALDTCARIASNSCLRRSVREAGQRLRNGADLSESLWQTGHFPRLSIGLLAVGESSGKLDLVLQKVSDIYDREAYETLEAMTKMLEPVVILILGGVVSVFVLGTLLPLYRVIAI